MKPRSDVLELMAEEVSGHAVDALASFVTWDGGRRKLDGMARGRRWDIDREHRAFERDTQREIRRLQKLRARRRRPEVYRVQRRRYEAEHKARRRELRLKRYRKNRDHVLAILRRSQEKHRERRRAEGRARYWANRERRLAVWREWAKKARPPKGARKCPLCGRPGYNRRTHARGHV